MNSDNITKQFLEKGVLLLLDSPAGMEFGIDNTSWKIGTKFKGVKLIPFGPHFVHYSLSGENHSFKQGFFIHVSPAKRIHVRKWSPEKEDFLCLPTLEEEHRYSLGVDAFQFDEFIGPYPMDRVLIWEESSAYISIPVLETLNPIAKKLYLTQDEYSTSTKFAIDQEQNINSLVMDFISTADQSKNSSREPPKKQTEENSTIEIEEPIQEKKETPVSQAPEDFSVLAGTIYYSDLPRIRNQAGKSGAQLTSLNLDKTPILKDYIKKKQSAINDLRKSGINKQKVGENFDDEAMFFIFGEFQYAFIMFLLAEDFSSLEQWKSILAILLCSDSYMDENPRFFIEFIPVLYNQLKQFPKDFFIDAISKDNFLKQVLGDFIEVAEDSANKKLSNRAKRLQKLLEEHFLFYPTRSLTQNSMGKYEFDGDPENAPQIVDESDIVYF